MTIIVIIDEIVFTLNSPEWNEGIWNTGNCNFKGIFQFKCPYVIKNISFWSLLIAGSYISFEDILFHDETSCNVCEIFNFIYIRSMITQWTYLSFHFQPAAMYLYSNSILCINFNSYNLIDDHHSLFIMSNAMEPHINNIF